jgi:hypothetical protein
MPAELNYETWEGGCQDDRRRPAPADVRPGMRPHCASGSVCFGRAAFRGAAGSPWTSTEDYTSNPTDRMSAKALLCVTTPGCSR